MFFCEFCKVTPLDNCFLSLSVNFEKFFRTFLLQSTSEKLLISCTEFQPADIVKIYFTGAFQVFQARTRSSHSKTFISLKSLKIICEGLIRKELLPTCKFTKKTFSHMLLPVFCLHFLKTHHDYFFRRGFESVQAKFLSGNVSKKQCYL